MKPTTKSLAAAGLVALCAFVAACNKDNSSNSNPNIPAGQSQVSVYLSDGPVDFYKVLVDIRQVAVLIDTGTKQADEDHDDQWDPNYWGWHRDENHKSVIWDTLNINPGVYDLLQLRNGIDTLLGSGTYPTGKLLKVRITLGSDNTIFTDSLTSYPLDVFGPHPYFDVNLKREHIYSTSSNDFQLWLDFNLQRSIFFWSGTYYLKPYIVAFNNHNGSRIEGFVLPPGASPLIEAFNSTDTVYAVPNPDGHYLIRAVPPGNYTISIQGHHGYQDTTLNDVNVPDNKTTKLPSVTLHK